MRRLRLAPLRAAQTTEADRISQPDHEQVLRISRADGPCGFQCVWRGHGIKPFGKLARHLKPDFELFVFSAGASGKYFIHRNEKLFKDFIPGLAFQFVWIEHFIHYKNKRIIDPVRRISLTQGKRWLEPVGFQPVNLAEKDFFTPFLQDFQTKSESFPVARFERFQIKNFHLFANLFHDYWAWFSNQRWQRGRRQRTRQRLFNIKKRSEFQPA